VNPPFDLPNDSPGRSDLGFGVVTVGDSTPRGTETPTYAVADAGGLASYRRVDVPAPRIAI